MLNHITKHKLWESADFWQRVIYQAIYNDEQDKDEMELQSVAITQLSSYAVMMSNLQTPNDVISSVLKYYADRFGIEDALSMIMDTIA